MAFLLLLLSCAQGEPLQALLERWNDDDPALRDATSREIVERWGEWDDEDLALLEGLVLHTDAEIASRAEEASAWIRVRLMVAGTVMETIPDIVEIVRRGSDADRVGVIQRCQRPEDLARVIELAEAAKWSFGFDSGSALLSFIPGPMGRFLIPMFLGNPDPQVRWLGIGSLQEQLMKEARPWLDRLLLDESVGVRLRMLEILEQTRPVANEPDLIPLLDDPEGRVRVVVLRILEAWKRRVPPELLLSRLDDPDPAALAAKIRSLGRNGFPEHREILLGYLRHPDPGVRSESLYALWALLEGDSLDDIRPFLEDEEEEVRLAAWEAVQRFGSEAEQRSMALRLLRDSGESIPRMAATLLADRDLPLLRSTLRAMLDQERVEERLLALRLMGEASDGGSLGDIERAIYDGDSSVRELALQVLLGQEHEGHLEAILSLLGDSLPRLQEGALRSLLDAVDRDLGFWAGAIPPLMGEARGELAGLLAVAVRRLEESEHVPWLVSLLSRESETVWDLALEALGSLLRPDQWPLLVEPIRAAEGDERAELLRMAKTLLYRAGEETLSDLVGCGEGPVALRALEAAGHEGFERVAILAPLLRHENASIGVLAAMTMGREVENFLWSEP